MEAREGSSSSSNSSSSSSNSSSHSGSPKSSPKASPAPVELFVEQSATQLPQSAAPVEKPATLESNEGVQASFTINLVQKEQRALDKPTDVQSSPPASEVVVSEPTRVDIVAAIPDLPITEDKINDDDNRPSMPPIRNEEPLVADEVSVQPHLVPSDTAPLLKDEGNDEVSFELPTSDEHEHLTNVDLTPTDEQSEKVTTSLPKSESSKPSSPPKSGADEKTSLLGSGSSQTKYSSSQPVTTTTSKSQRKCCPCCSCTIL